MRLRPYPSRIKRLEKVIRHYLNPGECWWRVAGCTFQHWHRQWSQLRVSGALVPDGWYLIAPGSTSDGTATQAHEAWFAAAQQAYDAARQRGTVFRVNRPDRHAYIGPAGVKVVATTDRADPALVTAYRIILKGLSYLVEPERYDQEVVSQEQARGQAADRINERAGVRRAGLYASLLEMSPADGQEER